MTKPIKVLLVSLFHPELVRGGAQQVCYELFLGLKSSPSIDATFLAIIDQTYPALYKTGAVITGFDGRPGEFLYLSRNYDYWWHKAISSDVGENFASFLELLKPDVVHFHHFMLLGLDMLSLTRRILPNAKIVLTLHEFVSICHADGHLVRRTDQSQCSRASSVRCHQCFPERRPEEFFMRNLWVRAHLATVDLFTTPTRFMIDIFAEWGLERSKIRCVPNGQDMVGAPSKVVQTRERRNRFGFFGQLVDIKGLSVLLEAVTLLRNEEFIDFFVEINGDNIRYASAARRTEVEDFIAAEERLPIESRRVRMNGSYEAVKIADRMSRIDWCIVPSLWREAFCLVVSEAWLCKRPVIVSNAGGLAERVRDEVDGLHFPLGDARALADVVKRASTEEGLWDRLVREIKPPRNRVAMVDDFIETYRGLVNGALGGDVLEPNDGCA